MKAKVEQVETRQNKYRLDLKEALPLNTPLTMHIELASACNLKCKFCFHGNSDLLKNHVYTIGLMELDLFKKVVDDLKQFPKQLNYISLHGRGESLLNPHIAEMVRYIKEANVSKKIGFNTNATVLTPELSEQLIDAGLDLLRISVEGLSSEEYLNITGTSINYEEFVNNIRYFYEHRKQCKMYIKIIDMNLSEEQKELFYDTFGEITDSIFIEKPADLWKGANLDKKIFSENIWGTENVTPDICSRPFYAYSVRYDGLVTACECDWKCNNVIGNAREKSLVELWNGEKMNAIRCKHLKKHLEEFEQCRDCEIKNNTLPKDNIDSIAGKLYEHYSNC